MLGISVNIAIILLFFKHMFCVPICLFFSWSICLREIKFMYKSGNPSFFVKKNNLSWDINSDENNWGFFVLFLIFYCAPVLFTLRTTVFVIFEQPSSFTFKILQLWVRRLHAACATLKQFQARSILFLFILLYLSVNKSERDFKWLHFHFFLWVAKTKKIVCVSSFCSLGEGVSFCLFVCLSVVFVVHLFVCCCLVCSFYFCFCC